MKTCVLFSAAILSLAGPGAARGQVVVANSNVTIADITKSDIREIFTGVSTSFKGGGHAVPVTLKGGPAHEAFLKEYVGKGDGAFRAGWRGLVFAGQGLMPASFDTDTALLDYIASVAGAIGYVGKWTEHQGVKTLALK